MKKFMILALALAATFMFVVPAMAVDLEFSGHYRLRGYFIDKPSLEDDAADEQGASDAQFDNRFRLQTVFKIHDRLKITTRFDGNDTTFESDSASDSTTGEDFDFERAWLTASFDMFDLHAGRMAGGFCGLKFCDSERDAARIKVAMKDIEPYFLTVLYEKRNEEDYDDDYTFSSDEADQDYDNYAALGGWTSESMEVGLLYVAYDDARDTSYDRFFHLFDPWFKGLFGPVTVQAEAQWFTGDWQDYDDSTADRDLDALRYFIDIGADLGVANVGVAYAHADGQERQNADNSEDQNVLPYGWFGGTDWEPLLILTHSNVGANLGGYGNLNGANGGYTANSNLTYIGMDMFYVYGSFAPMETLTLDATLGFVSADELGRFEDEEGLSNVDDDLGWEFDLGATWQIMDSLTYNIKAAYYDAGDFWKLGDSAAQVDDAFAVMNAMVVTF